jgi:hypothetical protein
MSAPLVAPGLEVAVVEVQYISVFAMVQLLLVAD